MSYCVMLFSWKRIYLFPTVVVVEAVLVTRVDVIEYAVNGHFSQCILEEEQLDSGRTD